MKVISTTLALVSCLILLNNNNAHAAPVTNELSATASTPSPIIQLTPEQLAAFEANTEQSEEVVPEGEREKFIKAKKKSPPKDDTTTNEGDEDTTDLDDEPLDDNKSLSQEDDTTPADDEEPSTRNEV
ncbi:hypothetical protein BJ944DRAFT_249049 [Cunninghamella echinulata]|nr:hypothetical protein BJ944DRAFT_249049 [Cunninghamella echinulata]